MIGKIIRKVVCMQCHKVLKVSLKDNILYVHPCTKCTIEYKKEGYKKGYEDGYCQKLSDEEYKDIVEDLKEKLEKSYIIDECHISEE